MAHIRVPCQPDEQHNRRLLPQLTVLILQLLQPTHLGRQQTIVLLLPVELRRLADASLAANIRNQHPRSHSPRQHPELVAVAVRDWLAAVMAKTA